MTHKIGFVEKNSDVPLKSVQEKALKEYGCDTIHIYEDKFDALKASIADLRDNDDCLVVYSIAVIDKHWWPKVCLAVAEVGGVGIFSVKTNKVYSFTYEEAKKNYDACMEIENAMKARVAKMGKNNSGKPLSKPWEHVKQIQAYIDDDWRIDELATKYDTSEATIRRIRDARLEDNTGANQKRKKK